jgi:FkbM family methyltransferase
VTAVLQYLALKTPGLVEDQSFWRDVHAFALRGMHYGAAAGEISTSGERHVLDLITTRTKGRRAVVFDVGAREGDYAAEVLARMPDAEVHCFEPSSAFVKLRERFQNVSCHRFALSNVEGSATLYEDVAGSGMGSLYKRRVVGRTFGVETRVALCALDRLPHGKIDLLKLDVEGHEFKVLEGAREAIADGDIECIQWEMGGTNLDGKTTFQDFWYALSPRYRICRIVADGLVEIERYEERLEVFVCSNWLAVKR